MIYKADSKEIQEYLKTLGDKEVEIKKYRKTTTTRQMRALHLWFKMIADALHSSNFDLRDIIRKDVEMFVTPYMIKTYMFKTVLKAITGKDSTREATTKEINQCFDIITKALGERTGIEYIAFPSLESLMATDLNKYENDN